MRIRNSASLSVGWSYSSVAKVSVLKSESPTPTDISLGEEDNSSLQNSLPHDNYRYLHTVLQVSAHSSPPCPIFRHNYKQCSGYVTFWPTDPDSAPDPALLTFKKPQQQQHQSIFRGFLAYYFLKVHLHHSSQINSQKNSQNSINQGVSYCFCLMMRGTGSVPLTNGSGSRRPKNLRIRIQNTVSKA